MRIGGHLDIVQVNEPGSPQPGRQHLFFKPDGKLHTKRPDGTVSEVGAVASGVVHSGTGTTPPANIGKTGDWWISTDGNKIYGPKGTDTAWGAPTVPTFVAGRTVDGTIAGTMAVPTGTQVGDLLLWWASKFDATPSIPVTFSTVATGVGAYQQVAQLGTRTATATDITNGFAYGAQSSTSHTIVAYRNTSGVRGFLAAGGGAATAPALTSVGVATKALFFAAHYLVPSQTTTGVTTVHTGAAPPAHGDAEHMIAEASYSGSGATLAPTITNGFAILTVALEPTLAVQSRDLPDDYASVKTRLTSVESQVVGAARPGVMYSGTGSAPLPSAGKTGDFWLSTDLRRIYGPKPTDNSWGSLQVPDFRGATTLTYGGGGGAGTLTLPSGTVAGDIAILYANSATGVSLPGTFTSTGQGDANRKTGTRTLTASDISTGSIAITHPSGGYTTVWILATYSKSDGFAAGGTHSGPGTAFTTLAVAVPGSVETRALYFYHGWGPTYPNTQTGVTNRATAGVSGVGSTLADSTSSGANAPTVTYAGTTNPALVQTIILAPKLIANYVAFDVDSTIGSRLAFKAHKPSVGVTSDVTSETFVDVDATNLVVTFTVPSSGAVVVDLDSWSTAGGAIYQWALRDNTTVVSGSRINMSNAAGLTRRKGRIYISGLTPGASLTWKWAHACVTSVTCSIHRGGLDSDAMGAQWGAATMEVSSV